MLPCKTSLKIPSLIPLVAPPSIPPTKPFAVLCGVMRESSSESWSESDAVEVVAMESAVNVAFQAAINSALVKLGMAAVRASVSQDTSAGLLS